jgi:hypothetical protein
MPVVGFAGSWPRRTRRSLVAGVLATLMVLPLTGLALTGVALTGVVLAGAVPAVADTAPVAPATRATVSADALPTVQINGVVWAQVVVGNTVYATGDFSSARPAGSAGGQNEIARANILAYDIRTGELRTNWAPTLNAQGLALAASADGSVIYVGGDFTEVSGTTHNRIVALEAATGTVVASFKASVNTRVRALAVSGGLLYAGGLFTTSSSQARARLAAFTAATGVLTDWNPGADREVLAIVVPAGTGKVVVGGRFSTLGGADNYGLGALSAATGAALAWPVNQVIRNAGDNAAITSLSSDGTRVYGTGYTFGAGGNLENSFASDLTGTLLWVSGCRGDTYANAPIGGVLYTVSHSHDCTPIGGHPQSTPETYQRAMAVSTTAGSHGETNLAGDLTGDLKGPFTGRPAPELLHWLPTLSVGSHTGQFQAAWSVAGNSTYVTLGGEFLAVNGVRQQGLARFAVKSAATNRQGPLEAGTLTPATKAIRSGALRVSWTAVWDRDNRRLTYEVLRNGVLIGKQQADSSWWNRPTVAFTDLTAPARSSVRYEIRVRDASGNVVTGPVTAATAPAARYAADKYATAVRADGAGAYWRLGESSGTTAYNWNSTRNLTLISTSGRKRASAVLGGIDKATAFPGGTTGVQGTSTALEPAPQSFSEELWFRSTSTTGGKLIGFGSSKTGDSTTADRQIYLGNNGRLNFGVLKAGQARTITSPKAYTNGKWHHVVATLGKTGMVLYVDGKAVATSKTVTYGQTYSGYWRVAGDSVSTGFANRPTRTRLAGALDEVAVYPVVLSSAAVAAHFTLGGR